MLLAVLIANSVGNILVERFHGVPAEERLHWRSFLVKLGADNLKGAKNEELYVASHKSVYVVYTVLGDVAVYVVGKDEYDELALAEVIFVITSLIKDACGKAPTERLFLDKYGKICLCLDEIVWMGILENTEKDRIKRLERVAEIGDSDERLMKVGRDIVDFHGEMVLLENYSALNYTGLAKILKKYDKRSGELIRVPFIKKVLRQPFYSTDVLGQLLKECETILDLLFFKKDLSSAAETVNEKGRRGGSEANTASESKEKVLNIPEDLEEIEYMESMYMKLTLSALKALKEIRGGSSTIDVFSWL